MPSISFIEPWLNPRAMLEQARNTLSQLPLNHTDLDPTTGQRGWFMSVGIAGTSPTRREQGPGVYGTSFAVRMLAISPSVGSNKTRVALCDGLRYLLTQMAFAPKPPARQKRKQGEVGHTDRNLTLKHVAALDAISAVIRIRKKDPEIALFLSGHTDQVREIVTTTIQSSIQIPGVAGATPKRGWSWFTGLTNTETSNIHLIPTVLAALALAEPNLPASEPFEDLVTEVANYLWTEIEFNEEVMLKALAFVGWSELKRKYDLHCLNDTTLRAFHSALSNELSQIAQLPWQELVHYDVPKSRHYRPSLWLSPRLIILRALLEISRHSAQRPCLATAAEIVRLIDDKRGGAQFLKGQPATLVANYDALQFIDLILRSYFTGQKNILLSSIIMFAYRTGISVRLPLTLTIIAMLGIGGFVVGVGAPFTFPESFNQSWTLFTTELAIIRSIWPLLIAWLAFCLVLGNRPFHQRVLQFAYGLASTMLGGVAASLLAATHPL